MKIAHIINILLSHQDHVKTMSLEILCTRNSVFSFNVLCECCSNECIMHMHNVTESITKKLSRRGTTHC